MPVAIPATRHPHHGTRRPGTGRADHRTAWEIEAQRIGAAELLAEACEKERGGEVVDPARLGRDCRHRGEMVERDRAA